MTVYPFEVLLNPEDSGLPKPSKVQAQQVRTISKQRIDGDMATEESVASRMGMIVEEFRKEYFYHYHLYRENRVKKAEVRRQLCCYVSP